LPFGKAGEELTGRDISPRRETRAFPREISSFEGRALPLLVPVPVTLEQSAVSPNASAVTHEAGELMPRHGALNAKRLSFA
jgi:hypothetical protein